MTGKELLSLAEELGFTAALIDSKDIPFNFSFRKYCEDNVCGNYGKTDTCPPGCGTPEELKAKMTAFPKALVLQTKWDVGDYKDPKPIIEAKLIHNGSMLKIAEKLGKVCMAGSSACTLCSPCKQLAGEPCPHPDKKFYCMSAYCIDVKALAEKCGMDYFSPDGKMGAFGVISYEKEQ